MKLKCKSCNADLITETDSNLSEDEHYVLPCKICEQLLKMKLDMVIDQTKSDAAKNFKKFFFEFFRRLELGRRKIDSAIYYADILMDESSWQKEYERYEKDEEQEEIESFIRKHNLKKK